MKNKLLIFALAIGFWSNAQQNNLLNTYSEDLIQLNPAAVGLNLFEANLNYRNQWLKAKDNPIYIHLDVAAHLGKNTGVGVKFRQQSLGLLNLTTVTGSYAYRLNFKNDRFLQLGAGLSFQQNAFRADKAVVLDQGDASLYMNTVRTSNFDVEAGALFVANRLKVGVGTQNLYNTNLVSSSLQLITKPQLNSHLSYTVLKKNKLEVEPWLVHRVNFGGKQQVEGLLNVRYNNLLMGGVGYRSSYGIIALVGFQLKALRVYYSYDQYMANAAVNYGASHQIMLSYVIGKRKALPVKEMVEETPAPVEKVVEPVRETVVEVVETPEETTVDVAPKGPSQEELELGKLEKMNAIARNLVFEVRQTTLPVSMNTQLDELANLMKASPVLVVNIQGYASTGGSDKLNQELSKKRAEFIRAEMVKRGVSSSNFKLVEAKGTASAEQTLTIEKSRTIRFSKAK